MKKINKIAAFAVLFVLLCILTAVSAFALDDPEIKYTEHCCVVSADYGDVLFEKNSKEKVYPAGTCKMMTALIAVEHYGENLSNTITVPEEAVSSSVGSTLGLSAGETVTVKDMLAALIIGNYNDAAIILATDISGSVDSFVSMMNERAKALGMQDTYFMNPTGIDEVGAFTTCYDVCLLGKELSANKAYTTFSDKTSYTFEGIGNNFGIYNRNCFISTFYNLNYLRESVFGLNSSATENAGSCVCIADKANNGFTYIVCVMGANDPETMPYTGCNTTYDDASTLLKWASDGFKLFTVVDTADMICEVPVELSDGLDHVILLPKTKINVMLPEDVNLDEEISFEYKLENEELRAPITEGQYVGKLQVYSKSKGYLGEVDLVSKSNVDRSSWLFFLDCVKDFIKSPVVIIAISLVVIALVGAIVIISIYIKRKNRRVRYRDPKKAKEK